MSVTDYIQKKEEGDQKNDTLIHKVMEAYVSLGKTITGDDGLVETEKLKDKEVRKAATSAIYRVFQEFTLEHFASTTTVQDRIEDLVFGLFGMKPQTISRYFEDNEERSSFETFFAYAQRQTALGYFLNQNSTEGPKVKLDEEDAKEAVTHTKTEGKVDPNKLTVDHMAELLNKFIEDGMIVDSFLKGKPYAIK
ncbi:TPA: hypothetical protein HA242_01095 [Candidatus Woesearchaeota archaeon]|nr:hypothetical protein [Candidatus Woesearchaeota archaeon]HIH12294.1 hypothetical protein [Candidatus Woesearchaeota archaeon]